MGKGTRTAKQELLKSLPTEWPTSLLSGIRAQVAESERKLVVLDDDPTGTQTVHDVPVITEWSTEILRTELVDQLPVVYILTNSRSLPSAEAQLLNREIGRNLAEAAHQVDRSFAVVSRSDSTLRGHFPKEVEALAEAVGQVFDGWLIIPFFLEGGRYTIGDVHYVAEGDWLIPAAETEFAQDTAFGYRSSDLRRWVEEKTEGRISSTQVASISIEDIRLGGPARVRSSLTELAGGAICVVNAASYRDLEVFTKGLLDAEDRGKRFLYRTAASFVRVRSGISPRPLLRRADLRLQQSGGGLLVVGSHVPRTTTQVETLLAETSTRGIEVNVRALLSQDRRPDEIMRVARELNQLLRQQEDVAVYTSRQLVTADEVAGNGSDLRIGQRVSGGLVGILQRVSERPRYLLAKGGVTSSDVATHGLHVTRAWVLGQILPGVPVWRLGEESRYPGLPYIVFPGNVGDAQALVEVTEMLALDPGV